MTAIGANIRKLREENGWTQHELAIKSDLHPSQISRIESGHETPYEGQLSRLARALRTSKQRLLEEAEHAE